MVGLSELLTITGLAIDVVGAAVIALPDIPHAKLILSSERTRKGLRKMESTGISEGEVGFSEIRGALEDIYGERLDQVWGFRVGQLIGSRYGFEDIFLHCNPNDENQEPLGEGREVDYRVARQSIKAQIDKQQALVRGSGFVLLATGFGLQIVGRLL